MIPTQLQDFLVEELKRLFEGFHLKNLEGEQVPFNIYPQFLPAKKGKRDKDHFPYILVALQDGEDPSQMEPNTCHVIIMLGVYDNDESYQGYKDTLNALQKTYHHLMSNQIFENQFSINYPIKWRVNEEDVYPYFFGGLETTWDIGKVSIIDTLT